PGDSPGGWPTSRHTFVLTRIKGKTGGRRAPGPCPGVGGCRRGVDHVTGAQAGDGGFSLLFAAPNSRDSSNEEPSPPAGLQASGVWRSRPLATASAAFVVCRARPRAASQPGSGKLLKGSDRAA